MGDGMRISEIFTVGSASGRCGVSGVSNSASTTEPDLTAGNAGPSFVGGFPECLRDDPVLGRYAPDRRA
jgi:hypothetical protein